MKIKQRYLLPLLLLLISGCDKEDFCNCLQKKGSDITETRKVENFTSLTMNNNIDVIVTPFQTDFIQVTSGSNLIDGIITEVRNGTLEIKNINKCNWLRDFKNKFTVHIYCSNLIQITNTGSGNLSCTDTLHTDELQLDNWNSTGTINLLLNCNEARLKLHTGPADIIAAGRAGVCYIYSAGNGFCKTSALNADYSYVTSKSTGDCEVNVNREIEAYIEYNGNVIYEGNPSSIKQHITGSGRLIAR
jgi:hypothetical protein